MSPLPASDPSPEATVAAKLSVITVTYESRRCLQERAADLAALPNWIVVDNASRDGTIDWLHSQFPQCRVIANPRNEGFARANNRALAEVRTPYALLLNPDCRIDAASLRALVDCAERYPDAALIGPRYISAEGRPLQCYRPFVHRRQGLRGPYVEPSGDLCTDFVTGAAVLVNMANMRAQGFFDPWYFLYCEDEDLCWNARAQGKAVMVASAALAAHSPMGSSAPRFADLFRRHYCHTLSKLYLRRKLGASRPAVSIYALSILGGSLLGLPLRLLLLSSRRLAQNLARIVAVLTAPFQLSRRRCEPGPGMLLSSLLSGDDAGSKP
ncbi:MAG TPA: glycosyltransferase family 2 protein [Solimonas sp.]|nr:glycosyltransferase family 2 protein [Solimonas sp.]